MKLTIAPGPDRKDISELSQAEAVAHLRDLMNATTQLCDVLSDYLGPERPDPRPKLRVLPGGKAGRK